MFIKWNHQWPIFVLTAELPQTLVILRKEFSCLDIITSRITLKRHGEDRNFVLSKGVGVVWGVWYEELEKHDRPYHKSVFVFGLYFMYHWVQWCVACSLNPNGGIGYSRIERTHTSPTLVSTTTSLKRHLFESHMSYFLHSVRDLLVRDNEVICIKNVLSASQQYFSSCC